jgi:hypothetical protein
MQTTPHILVAIFDATPEHAVLADHIHTNRARSFGQALGKSGMSIIARVGSPLVTSSFGGLSDSGAVGIALSPATSHHEHEIAYRLPKLSAPTIFTGKGAYGTDTIALSSAQALAVLGSHIEVLENILEHTKDHTVPILVLTDEEPTNVHERVRALYPNMTSRLIVSADPEILVGNLAGEMRRKRFEN